MSPPDRSSGPPRWSDGPRRSDGRSHDRPSGALGPAGHADRHPDITVPAWGLVPGAAARALLPSDRAVVLATLAAALPERSVRIPIPGTPVTAGASTSGGAVVRAAPTAGSGSWFARARPPGRTAAVASGALLGASSPGSVAGTATFAPAVAAVVRPITAVAALRRAIAGPYSANETGPGRSDRHSSPGRHLDRRLPCRGDSRRCASGRDRRPNRRAERLDRPTNRVRS